VNLLFVQNVQSRQEQVNVALVFSFSHLSGTGRARQYLQGKGRCRRGPVPSEVGGLEENDILYKGTVTEPDIPAAKLEIHQIS
jgi:hypothetical protein